LRTIARNAYWKDGRLRKKYIGKTRDELLTRKAAKQAGTTPTKMRKLKFIKETAQKGNLVAQEYVEKVKNGNVRLDWTYKVLMNIIDEQRTLKIPRLIIDSMSCANVTSFKE
jgi:ribosome-binding protein aMBF1 (putative translation factor)